MHALARMHMYEHGRRWSRTCTHEDVRTKTDADVHARTRMYEDGRGRIMGFKRPDVQVREQTHTGARWTYGHTRRKKNTQYAADKTVKNYNISFADDYFTHRQALRRIHVDPRKAPRADTRTDTQAHGWTRRHADIDARMQMQPPNGAWKLNMRVCSTWVGKSSRCVLHLDEHTRTFEMYYMYMCSCCVWLLLNQIDIQYIHTCTCSMS